MIDLKCELGYDVCLNFFVILPFVHQSTKDLNA
jgi:hypothetical protein